MTAKNPQIIVKLSKQRTCWTTSGSIVFNSSGVSLFLEKGDRSILLGLPWAKHSDIKSMVLSDRLWPECFAPTFLLGYSIVLDSIKKSDNLS